MPEKAAARTKGRVPHSVADSLQFALVVLAFLGKFIVPLV